MTLTMIVTPEAQKPTSMFKKEVIGATESELTEPLNSALTKYKKLITDEDAATKMLEKISAFIKTNKDRFVKFFIDHTGSTTEKDIKNICLTNCYGYIAPEGVFHLGLDAECLLKNGETKIIPIVIANPFSPKDLTIEDLLLSKYHSISTKEELYQEQQYVPTKFKPKSQKTMTLEERQQRKKELFEHLELLKQSIQEAKITMPLGLLAPVKPYETIPTPSETILKKIELIISQLEIYMEKQGIHIPEPKPEPKLTSESIALHFHKPGL